MQDDQRKQEEILRIIHLIDNKSNTNKTSVEKIKSINGSRPSTTIQFLELEENKVVSELKDIANILAEKFKLNSNNRNYFTTFLSNTSNENQATDLLNYQEGEDEHIVTPIEDGPSKNRYIDWPVVSLATGNI